MLLHFPLTSFYCVLLKELLEESVEAELQVINSFINCCVDWQLVAALHFSCALLKLSYLEPVNR